MLLKIVLTVAVCYCSLFTTDTTGLLLTEPQNTAVVTGVSAFFHCSSNEPFPSWRFENLDIVTSNCSVLESYKADFEVEITEPDTCNLIVLNATLAKGGKYSCFDADETKSAVLTVIGSVMVAMNNRTEVVEGDVLNLGCTVMFNTSSVTPMLPVLRWISPTSENITNATIHIDVTPGINSITSSIDIIAQRPDILPYTCAIHFEPPVNATSDMATNAPNGTLEVKTYPIYGVYYPVEQVIIQIDKSSSDEPLKFTCQASSLPGATYQWHSSNGLTVDGPVLYVDTDGPVNCTASNVIRGKTYSTSTVINIHVQNNSQNNPGDNGMTDAEIAAITLGVILGIILLAGTIFLIYMLWEKNRVDHSDDIKISIPTNYVVLNTPRPYGSNEIGQINVGATLHHGTAVHANGYGHPTDLPNVVG